MNPADADPLYAVTRLRARYALLAGDTEWARLERAQLFAAYLQQARDGALQRWVVHFDPEVEPHRIEAALRDTWLKQVAAVSSWLPSAEAPAAAWIARLDSLPALRHRAAGHEPYSWLTAPEAEPPAGAADGAALLRGWLEQWQELWPDGLEPGARADLERLRDGAMQLLRGRLAGFDTDALQAALRRSFRWQQASLAAACIYLALLRLELMRLRGGLLRRRLLLPAGRSIA